MDRNRFKRWRRRLLIGVAVSALLLAVFVVSLPSLICNTGVRDIVLRKGLPDDIHAACESLSIGWVTPLTITNMDLRDADGEWTATADKAGGSRSLIQLLFDSQDLGTLTIDRPVVSIYTNVEHQETAGEENSEASNFARDCKLQLKIIDATIRVGDAPDGASLLTLSPIHLTANYQKSDQAELLEIQPCRPIDGAKLTPELCHRGIRYVAPILASVAWTDGTVSLDLEECRIRLDDPHQSQVVGTLGIHSVRAGAKEGSVVKQIIEAVALTAKSDLATTIHLADESLVRFRVQDGFVSHEGLEFGIPKLSRELLVRTKGKVGLVDRSLDLNAQIPLPLHLLGDGPIAAALGSQQLSVPVRGTLDKPEVQLQGDGKIVSELISKLGNPLVSGDVSVADILSELRKRRSDNQDARQERPGLLQRLRDRRDRRRESPTTGR